MTLLGRTEAWLATTVLLTAGAVVGVVVGKIPLGYAVAAWLMLVIALMVVTYIRKVKRQIEVLKSVPGTGISEVLGSPEAARAELSQRIAQADDKVRLIGISHRSLLGDAKLLDAIDKFLQRRSDTLEVYFVAGDAPSLATRAEDEGEDPAAFTSDVEANTRRFVRWATSRGHDSLISFFLYEEYPSWRIEQVDRDLFVSSYPQGASGQMSQVWFLVPNDANGSLHAAFCAVVERLVRAARPLPLEP